MRAFWALIILLAITIGWYGGGNPQRQGRLVPDVSWPNCSLKVQKAEAGIVGITGGLANRPNPCLAYQAERFNQLSVYVNTGYPGTKRALKFQNSPKQCSVSDSKCLAYNYGYNSGRYDIDLSLKNAVIAKNWWLDVETENSWDDSTSVNRAALTGTLDVLMRFVSQQNLGFYSYPGQWNLLTGHWRNGYPAWVATGSSRAEDAINACKGPSFTGGQIVYGQFTPSLDQNYFCN